VACTLCRRFSRLFAAHVFSNSGFGHHHLQGHRSEPRSLFGIPEYEHTSLDRLLRDLAIRRLFVGGLATDYCVLNTVKDARKEGYDVCLLTDGIKAVDLFPDDGRRAEEEMINLGAMPVRVEMLEA